MTNSDCVDQMIFPVDRPHVRASVEQDGDRVSVPGRQSRGSRPSRRVSASAALLPVALVAVAVAACSPFDADVPADGRVSGQVVDDRGQPVAGATVRGRPGPTVVSDGNGAFEIDVPRATMLTATADGYLGRTQAVAPDTRTEVRLSRDAESTASLRFGGDVMFGRRYYDRNEDGDQQDGLLRSGASAEDHAALLEHVAPLLADADLTVVNFETPVTTTPWFDPTGPRPGEFHSTKEFVFASAGESIDALKRSGVDLVSLGNNHVNDALGDGLAETLAALDAAGMPRFGAGLTVDQAWEPAVLTRKGQTFAFLGCTTITGREHAYSYVADGNHGGAARCTSARLQAEVRATRERADTVVVMIHGGEEYEADQTQLVRDFSAVAARAGAALVVNGHPHVVGGVTTTRGGSTLTAETLGNLLFDQTVWPTFLSYLLRVDVRADRPVMSTVDPLFLEGYVPRASVGLLADSAARRAAGFLPGPGRLRPPGALISAPRGGRVPDSQRRLDSGTVVRLAPGWWAGGAAPPGDLASLVAGEDLLWRTGSFDDMDVDPSTRGAHMWALGASARTSGEASCAGNVGVELSRRSSSEDDIVVSPKHRQLVTAGTRVSLLARVRAASPGSTLELRWYRDTKGGSSSGERIEIPVGSFASDACPLVRIDAVVPPGVVAAQPFVRLAPAGRGYLQTRLAVDEVQLIAWAEPGHFGRRYDTLDALEDVTVRLFQDVPLARTEPFADIAQ